MNLTIEDIRMLAEGERKMDSGEQPFVNGPGGRLMVMPDVMEELGLVSGQTISATIMTTILEAQLASVQARIALDKAATKPAA